MPQQPLIHYHVRWRPSGHQPGASRGIVAGIGDQLRSVVLLRDHPDPRRLDLRASVRDPFANIWVRDFNLNSALKVIVLVDTSASMGYVGQVNRMHVAQEIASQLALSAYRSGDAFGLFAAGEAMNKQCMLPPKANRGAWLWVNHHFSKLKPQGQHANGLFAAVPYLPQRRCLVFLISDFRWQAGKLKQLLKKMAHHDVVPVMLQDPAEMDALPKSGIAILRDTETGAAQFVWMRESLKKQMQNLRAQHVRNVEEASRKYGNKPFVVKGEFSSALLTKYFMERSA
ncbi:MAG: VWA domain-containing protein [Methylotenera sp.]|uniref:DUF58 domain-containing protein n=1 Tax=Methylotenera sp. TaxID=2051956 RepID=UPI0017B53386|nr:VWA domain-containing protein [Methylotenera sp.]NOU24342.1 VWA domain-containing protein [Methylotenera sp.]